MRFYHLVLIALAAAIGPAATSLATVSLTISDTVAPTGSVTVAPGGTFTFTVRLVSTAEQTTGLDYYLTASTPDIFTITDRNTAGGAYSDTLFFDDATVEATPSSILNPRNDHDLGGLSPVTRNAGTHTVATYTIAVSPTAPFDSYTIQTTSNPGEGYIYPTPTPGEAPFNSHGTFTVVIPEPSTLAMAAIGLASLAGRRRRPLRS